jgi:hypothetical protein
MRLGNWPNSGSRPAVKAALAGDRDAREWVGNSVLGKPAKQNLLDRAAKELLSLFMSIAFGKGNDKPCTNHAWLGGPRWFIRGRHARP